MESFTNVALTSFPKHLTSVSLFYVQDCSWKSSEVVPVFKNDGERSDPGKYRPISHLPNVSKIFESFINNSLIKHLDSTGLFSDLQYGFRTLRSTADIQ